MAGGPSTPELVAAVGSAGGLGVLPSGYRPAAELTAAIARTRSLTDRPFGVNLFVPSTPTADRAPLLAYRDALLPLAARLGVAPGEPTWDDDGYPAKVDVCAMERVPLVTLSFGCPTASVVDRLHAAGCEVLVTVTSAAEAAAAREVGADGLVAQGSEAGAHQGGWLGEPAPLLSVLASVVPIGLPVVATGALMTGADVARVLAAGAVAAQLGTAFLLCPEAGTTPVHRAALRDPRFSMTELTRAFTGRPARGLVNAFLRDHRDAPAGYPEVHAVTSPLRRAAAAAGDADAVHLWAGEGWRSARSLPAGELVAVLAAELAAG
jgi:nitronate monooxygenase